MEQYNLLIIEQDSPGLRIIQTQAYKNLITTNPRLVHKNAGDFYSNIPVADLSDIVCKTFEQELFGKKLNENMVVVDAATFNQQETDTKKDYLIREIDGIRLYSPQFHTTNAGNVSELYSFIGLLFIEKLFAEEQEGSLQQGLRKAFEDLKPSLDAMQTLSP